MLLLFAVVVFKKQQILECVDPNPWLGSSFLGCSLIIIMTVKDNICPIEGSIDWLDVISVLVEYNN